MKKVIGILAAALILSGCGSSSDNHDVKKSSFMKEGKNSLYALYNTKGQRYTKDMYKAYTPFEGGYLVTDANDQTGYISNTGKTIVKPGRYTSLKTQGNMLVGENQPQTRLYLSASTLEMTENTLTQVFANDAVVWSTNDNDVININQQGYVYAKHAGTAVLTATKDNASVTCVIKVEALHPYFDHESLDVYTSEPATLTVNDYGARTIEWKSKDPKIATVENGVIQGLKPGTTTISAKVGDDTLECKVKVKRKTFKISHKEATFYVGDEGQLGIENAYPDIKWETSNAAVATVANGHIWTMSPGKATLKATSNGQTVKCVVTVKKRVPRLDQTKVTLLTDQKVVLNILDKANPEDVVQWSSNKKKIASVNEFGEVTGLKKGKAVITAKIGKKKYKATVTVKKRQIKINPAKTTIEKDQHIFLQLLNKKDEDQAVWTTSNDKVVIVAQSGEIAGVKPGKATITAQVGKQKAKAEITVKAKPLSLSETKIEMDEGSDEALSINNYENQKVKWTSSDESIATVENGIIHAKKEGKVTITATIDKKDYTCDVTVHKLIKVIDQKEMTVIKGGQGQLTITNVDPEKIKWNTSDYGIATVANGTVYGLKTGKATITGKVGKKTYTCKVTVVRNPDTETKTKAADVSLGGIEVLNTKGKVLYKSSAKTGLLKTNLPVVVKDKTYKVINNGKTIYEGKKKVYYASSYEDASIVAFNDSINIYLKNGKKTSIKEVGNYSILAARKDQAILYDAYNQNTLGVIGTKVYSNDYALTDAEITKKNNVVLTAGDVVSLYKNGQIIPTNSNYKDNTHFISRNKKVAYGPHTVYNGKKKTELKGVQVYPYAYELTVSRYPGFVKGKGYAYYDFNGKKVSPYYQEANQYDENKCAIVQLKNNKYELINAEGENVLKESYPRLEFIGNSYYAAYNKNGQFKVYDCNGKEALSDIYTKIPETAAIVFDGHPYLALEKNGRSYIYDVDNGMKEIYSIEKEIVLHEEGYFTIGDKYYTLTGQKIK
ncbi:Ig-like domain-containing protein [uncultured Catenibacterium sp.]|uniref:Ig-like domain-containing protein n=1 Tax=uncultured Catenibacterium sp. TaxID=286142 RepID=UPI0025E264AF|nr:Ig-like domain-containing protein [uncultured Catenibacterium sp.]